MLTVSPEEVAAASEFDEFGNPIAGGHQRIDPFDAGNTRSRLRIGFASRLRRDAVDSVSQLRTDFPTQIPCTDGGGHTFDVAPDVCKRHRVHRKHLGSDAEPCLECVFEVPEARRSDLTLSLGEDQGGFERAQKVRVDSRDR